jgi:hypothetical protein
VGSTAGRPLLSCGRVLSNVAPVSTVPDCPTSSPHRMVTERLRLWMLPVLNAFASAGVCIAINFATGPKSSWIAWGVVAVVTATSGVLGAAATPRGERPVYVREHFCSACAPGSISSETSGVVIRATETIDPGGSTTRTVEIYSDAGTRMGFRD